MKGLTAVLCATSLVWACGSGAPTAPAGAPTADETRTPSPTPISGTRITIGQTVDGRVELDAPHCFPDWDTLARCRQFDLTPDADATVVATLMWTQHEWDPDLFVVRPGGTWIWASGGPPSKASVVEAKANQTYRIVVMSSLPRVQEFTLAVARQR